MNSLLGARQYGVLLQAQAAAVGSLRVLHDRLFNSSSTPTPAPPIDTEEPKQHYEPGGMHPVDVVHKLGPSILHDPWFNKGTSFPASERERLGLRGLIPPVETNMQLQIDRFMQGYRQGIEMIPAEDIKSGGVDSNMARQWLLLQALQDRNETLFYKILIDNFVEMAPIVYTPTVGWACVNYHRLYRRPRGMYFSAQDKGEMAAMAYNWPQRDVHAIVVTDGSRILGLGDLGLNGLGIPIGKLDLYCAAAGFSPAKVLPCVIDVGTNNERLLNDPLYCGLRQKRITGEEYYEIVDEFVRAVMARWPTAVLQFEDFSIDHARTLLERYRHQHLVFNDDIQGTAATALAGLYGAMEVLGKPQAELANQRVVCVGAGSAGMGVVRTIAAGMEKQQKLSFPEATERFWVIDARGLITEARQKLPEHVAAFARRGDSEVAYEGQSLIDVIKRVKPTVLLGLAGAGRLFTEPVLKALAEGCRETGERPIVFPMSNPISRMECTLEEAVQYTDGEAVVAMGSPQKPVEYKGKHYFCAQANNMFTFPAIALGSYLGHTGIITDEMIMAAAETLPKLIKQEDLQKGIVYPRLEEIRDITAAVAAEVIKVAALQGHASGDVLEPLAKGDEQLRRWIRRRMFYPQYSSLAYLPPGVGE